MGPFGYCAQCLCRFWEEDPQAAANSNLELGQINGPSSTTRPNRAVTTVAGTAVCMDHVQHEMRLRPVDRPRFASSCAFGGAAS